jgi:hypothetical protein
VSEEQRQSEYSYWSTNAVDKMSALPGCVSLRLGLARGHHQLGGDVLVGVHNRYVKILIYFDFPDRRDLPGLEDGPRG